MDCNSCNHNANRFGQPSASMFGRGMCYGRNTSNMRTGNNMNRNMNYSNAHNKGCGCSNNTNERNAGCGRSNNTNERNVGCGRSNNTNERNAGCGRGDNMTTRDSECRCNSNSNCMKQDIMRCKDGCDKGNEPVDRMAPGMSFVPWQQWTDIYDIDKAIERGTIFGELDKPYLGRPMQ